MFGFKITYNKPDGYSLYNGNITQTQWKTSNDNILRRYDYEYDALNRLKESRFYKNNVAEQYHEGGIVYDKNGNIQNLKRWGLKNDATTLGLIDDLSYNYKVYSNQLLKVTDNSLEPTGFTDADNSRGDNDYGYDASGNMDKDLNKGIGLTLGEEITYNHLNLPVKIIKDDNNYLEFTYDATGTKLQKKEFNQGNETITQYLHGFVYLNNELEYFAHPEGYVDKDFSYIYQYKDHLGNVRLSYKKNGSSLQILEEDNYYPFGLKHKGYNKNTFSSNLGQKIKYQGQERQEELNINWDSFKWRNYDYAIGRFFNTDPLAEKYVHNGVYNFSENKVIDSRELEGLEAVKVTDLQAKTINVTVRIKPVNETSGFPLTNDQITTAMGNFKSQAERSWSGKNSKGMTVNVSIINDPKATLTIKFVDVVVNPDNKGDSEAQIFTDYRAGGFTAAKDHGNTQTGTFQISSNGTFPQEQDAKDRAANPKGYVEKAGAGHSANHELGHIFGNGEQNDIPGNLMNQNYLNSKRKTTEKQRDTMLNNIPEWKP